MTQKANARLAGFMFLFYIAIGLLDLSVSGRASIGESAVAKLASMAQQAQLVRLSVVLGFLTCFAAVSLAVALYGLTRHQDHELALLALSCRLVEGTLNANAAIRQLGLLAIATASVGTSASEAGAAQSFGASILRQGGASTLIGSSCFAIGSTIFSYLFLRARNIPLVLAWIGLVGSALLVVGLLLQLGGVLHGTLTYLMWAPVAVFEVVLGFWLLIKGVAAPVPRPSFSVSQSEE
jgi:uncharacterized protein DUF4386